jgi:hypothetical protein
MEIGNYKDMLGGMYSADHFAKTVQCTMTELADII